MEKSILNKLKNIKPSDYVRLFEFRNYPLFYDSLWLQFYQEYEALCINVDNLRTSYIPVTQFKRSLSVGKKLYSDPSQIKKFKKEFNDVEKQLLAETEILSKSDNNINKIPELFKIWFKYYSLTDFHCTDNARKQIDKYFPDFGDYKKKKRISINKIATGQNSYLMKFLKRYSSDKKINNKHVRLHTIDEIISNKFINIAYRQNSVLTMENNKYIMLTGKKAIETATKMRKVNLGKGQTANKGKITGTVFVFHNDMSDTDQISALAERMPTGSILICETTSPDIAPLYKKANGLITAQGGIMSHASIISRELNLPCIVGMDNVTRLFQTGDSVLLDAEKCEITKL